MTGAGSTTILLFCCAVEHIYLRCSCENVLVEVQYTVITRNMSSMSGSGGNRGGNCGEKRDGREKRDYRKEVKLRKYTLQQEKKEVVARSADGGGGWW